MQRELLPKNYWCCAMISYWGSFILKWDPWEGFRVTKKNTKACLRFAKKTAWWFPKLLGNNLWTKEINLFRTFEFNCILHDTNKALHEKSIIQLNMVLVVMVCGCFAVSGTRQCPPSVHILKLKQDNNWNHTSKSTSECVKKIHI